MTFQLDTSGHILMGDREMVGRTKRVLWSDLDPFTQGYIEELFADLGAAFRDGGQYRFSDLARETLARIIDDCASFANIAAGLGQKTGAVEGRRFWTGRQNGLPNAFGAAFPPLTVSLGDDGKVCFQ